MQEKYRMLNRDFNDVIYFNMSKLTMEKKEDHNLCYFSLVCFSLFFPFIFSFVTNLSLDSSKL